MPTVGKRISGYIENAHHLGWRIIKHFALVLLLLRKWESVRLTNHAPFMVNIILKFLAELFDKTGNGHCRRIS